MPNKIKIMIIEDEDAISNFIATTLKANAYAASACKNSRTGTFHDTLPLPRFDSSGFGFAGYGWD